MPPVSFFDPQNPLPTGNKVRFDASLVSVLVEHGYKEEKVAPVIWRILAYRVKTDAFGYEQQLMGLVDEKDEDNWLWLRAQYWNTLIIVPLSLPEKERLRMASEPWNKKRDANLRLAFKPTR